MPLTPKQAVRAKNLWVDVVLPQAIAEDIDRSNLGKKHPIGLEGTPHCRTRELKVLVAEHGDWTANIMPETIIKTAKKIIVAAQKPAVIRLSSAVSPEL